MAKITYLLGAGASANTIPIVANFHQRLKEITSYLLSCLPPESSIYKKPFIIPDNLVNNLNEIIDELQWLIESSKNYYTIDTLAKKYYLTNNWNDLNRLKKCLVTYFTIEQSLYIESKYQEGYTFKKAPLDMRYDSFIASISNKINDTNPKIADRITLKINDDIKILSWNYDVQFELSLQRFLEKKIHFLQYSFQIIPNKWTLGESEGNHIDSNKFAIVKLNGNAIWDEVSRGNYPEPLYQKAILDSNPTHNNEELLKNYLIKYKDFFFYTSGYEENTPLEFFNFAWENDKTFQRKYSGHSKNIEAAESIARDTEILVVIGYSFPIFNREIDNRLFKKMTNLKKVYIQDKHPERIKSTLINAFKIMQEVVVNGNRKVNIEEQTNTDQFIVPYELYSE